MRNQFFIGATILACALFFQEATSQDPFDFDPSISGNAVCPEIDAQVNSLITSFDRQVGIDFDLSGAGSSGGAEIGVAENTETLNFLKQYGIGDIKQAAPFEGTEVVVLEDIITGQPLGNAYDAMNEGAALIDKIMVSGGINQDRLAAFEDDLLIVGASIELAEWNLEATYTGERWQSFKNQRTLPSGEVRITDRVKYRHKNIIKKVSFSGIMGNSFDFRPIVSFGRESGRGLHLPGHGGGAIDNDITRRNDWALKELLLTGVITLGHPCGKTWTIEVNRSINYDHTLLPQDQARPTFQIPGRTLGQPVDRNAQSMRIPSIRRANSRTLLASSRGASRFTGETSRSLGRAKSVNNILSMEDALSVTTYPNPATDYLTIDVGSTSVNGKVVAIFNSLGQQVDTYVLPTTSTTISVEGWPKGLYSLVVNGMGESQQHSTQVILIK